MEVPPERDRSLVAIDLENMLVTLEQFPPRTRRLMTPWMVVEQVMALARTFGSIIDCLVFGDFEALGVKSLQAVEMWRLGATLCYCPKIRRPGDRRAKDIVDPSIVHELEKRRQWPELTRVILASGDADFLPLLHRFREDGRKITVVTTTPQSAQAIRGAVQDIRYLPLNLYTALGSLLEDFHSTDDVPLDFLLEKHGKEMDILGRALHALQPVFGDYPFGCGLILLADLLLERQNGTLRGYTRSEIQAIVFTLHHLRVLVPRTTSRDVPETYVCDGNHPLFRFAMEEHGAP